MAKMEYWADKKVITVLTYGGFAGALSPIVLFLFLTGKTPVAGIVGAILAGALFLYMAKKLKDRPAFVIQDQIVTINDLYLGEFSFNKADVIEVSTRKAAISIKVKGRKSTISVSAAMLSKESLASFIQEITPASAKGPASAGAS